MVASYKKALLLMTTLTAAVVNSLPDSDPPVPTVLDAEAGIVVSLHQKFFDTHHDDLVDYLNKNIGGMTLADSNPEFSIGALFPKMVFNLSKQKIKHFKISSNSVPQITADWPHLLFHMRGVDLDFDLDYEMTSKPEWLFDHGKGDISIRGMNITL